MDAHFPSESVLGQRLDVQQCLGEFNREMATVEPINVIFGPEKSTFPIQCGRS